MKLTFRAINIGYFSVSLYLVATIQLSISISQEKRFKCKEIQNIKAAPIDVNSINEKTFVSIQYLHVSKVLNSTTKDVQVIKVRIGHPLSPLFSNDNFCER